MYRAGIIDDSLEAYKEAGSREYYLAKCVRMREERGIKYQFINIKEKGMSKGEFTSVVRNGKKSTFGYQPDVWEE